MLLMSATVSAQFGGFFKDAKKYARQRERDETIAVEQKRHYDNVKIGRASCRERV